MAKKYRFFYAADIIKVVSDKELGPAEDPEMNKAIDLFEAKLLKTSRPDSLLKLTDKPVEIFNDGGFSSLNVSNDENFPFGDEI